MATVTLVSAAGSGPMTKHGNTAVPYVIEVELDYATATTVKGSALANADVIQLFKIPADSIVLNAGLAVKTVTDSTDITVAIGDGTTTYQAALDVDSGTAAGHVGTLFTTQTRKASEVTVSATLGQTSAFVAPTSGKLRIYMTLVSIADRPAPGLAPRGG